MVSRLAAPRLALASCSALALSACIFLPSADVPCSGAANCPSSLPYCSDGSCTATPTPPADGGARDDAGASEDAGGAAEDAGSTPPEDDGGTPPEDAGSTPPEDGGSTPPEDAGSTPPEDAGSTPPEDAGSTPPEDGGSTPPEDGGSTPPEDGGGACVDEVPCADGCCGLVDEIVAAAGRVGEVVAVDVGPDGTPHLLYTGNGATSVHYAKRVLGAWETAVVESGTGSVGALDIAVEPGGTVHASWASPSQTRTLKYAVLDDAIAPETVAVDLGAGGRGRHELRIAPDGQPRVAYISGVGPTGVDAFRPRYAVRTGAGWSTEALRSLATDDARHLAFALGSGGQPHVVWNDYYDQASYYATKSDSGWTIETFATFGSNVPELALALAPDNTPLVASVRPGDETWLDELYVARRTGVAQWEIDPVEQNTLEIELNLAIGTDGRPRLAYRSSNTAPVRFAARTEAGWLVTSLGASAATIRMALDAADVPHIVWQDWDAEDVHYATLE